MLLCQDLTEFKPPQKALLEECLERVDFCFAVLEGCKLYCVVLLLMFFFSMVFVAFYILIYFFACIAFFSGTNTPFYDEKAAHIYLCGVEIRNEEKIVKLYKSAVKFSHKVMQQKLGFVLGSF